MEVDEQASRQWWDNHHHWTVALMAALSVVVAVSCAPSSPTAPESTGVMEVARAVALSCRDIAPGDSEGLDFIFAKVRERAEMRLMGGEDLLMIERGLLAALDVVGDEAFSQRLQASDDLTRDSVSFFLRGKISEEFPESRNMIAQARPERTEVAEAYRDPKL